MVFEICVCKLQRSEIKNEYARFILYNERLTFQYNASLTHCSHSNSSVTNCTEMYLDLHFWENNKNSLYLFQCDFVNRTMGCEKQL